MYVYMRFLYDKNNGAAMRLANTIAEWMDGSMDTDDRFSDSMADISSKCAVVSK